MCGNHRGDGTPVDHHHRPVFLPRPRGPRPLHRRAFLGEVGKGTIAFAVLAPAFIAACGDDGEPGTSPTTTSRAPTSTADDPPPPTSPPAGDATPVPAPLRWARTNHGFVSSYVLIRGTEAAIVDTGSQGSSDAIGMTLGDLGLTYGDVGHVVLTHHHPDHIGSIDEVLAQAERATAYAGAEDLDEIARDTITAVGDGDDIFGLEVLHTPGHTDGHISVIDHDAGVLVAGDAMLAADGGVQGPSPDFSEDLDVAHDSVRRLAEFTFNTLLVGHGDPVEGMADTAVAALAASL